MTETADRRPRRANPYVGLVPFSESDAGWFFGREREQRIIGANLRASRLTLLYGSSGVGKSSVLLAAVIPALRAIVAKDRALLADRDPQTGRPVRFAVSVFGAWRDSPLLGLMTAVAASVQEATGRPVTPWTPGTPLRETFAGWLGPVGSLLIVLDQFEEFFLYHPDEDGPGTFAGEFVDVVNDPALRVNFIVSLREDGLARLDRFKGRIPGLFDNYLRVDHLDLDAARRAITGPLEEYNRRLEEHVPRASIDPELIEAVLAEVATGDNGATQVETPLLQLVMQRLWVAADGDGAAPRLGPDTLTERLGGTENILLRHLGEALAGLTHAQRELAASVLTQLVSPSKTKFAFPAQDLAHRCKRDLGDVEELLRELSTGERRILRAVAPPPDGRDRPVSFEIFHDVLAEPILMWCAAHEAEREREELKATVLAQERGRRRARRKHVVRIAAVLAAAGFVALYLVEQRSGEIEASRAVAASAVTQLPLDPERSLLLALGAVDKHRTPASEDALRQALSASRVRAVVRETPRGLRAQACAACRAMLATPGGDRGYSTTRLAISPDGRTVAGIVGDRLWIWSPASGRALRPRVDLGDVNGVAFTPDGSRLLATGWKASALMAPGGSRIDRLGGSGAGGATSPDGRHIVTLGSSGADVWTVLEGRRVGRLKMPYLGDDAQYESAAFDGPDTVVLKEVEGGLHRWRWGSSARSAPLAPAAQNAGGVFSAAPFFAVTGAGVGKAAVVDERGRRTPLFSGNAFDPVSQLAIGPDAERVVTVRGSKATLWRSADPPWRSRALRITDLVHGDGVEGVAFSPDGELVATASIDGAVRIWESSNGALAGELRGHTTGVQAIGFGPSGRFVASVGEDLTLRLWDLGEERVLRTNTSVVAAPVSPSGKVAVLEQSGRLKFWDPEAGTVRALQSIRGVNVTSAALAPGGESLAVGFAGGASGGGVLIFDGRTGRQTTRGDFAQVFSLAVGPGARTVATAGTMSDNPVSNASLWDPLRDPPDQSRALAEVTSEAVTDAAFSPDGRRVVITSVVGRARIYDVESRRLLRVLGQQGRRQGPDSFYRAVFSPDGETVAVAASRDVRMWKSRTGEELTQSPLRGHTLPVTGVAFSRDGKRIVTASGDRTTRLWDAASGRVLAVMRHHADRVNGVAFGPGDVIVSGSDDRTVRAYRCESCGPVDALLRRARAQVTRELTSAEREDYLGER